MESCKIGEKHTGICVPNSVEMHLLHDCEDLVSKQRKLVSDLIDKMQTNPYQEDSLFGKLSGKYDDSASTLRTPNCFDIAVTSLLLHSIHLGGILQLY